MRILAIGGTGFIGRFAIPTLTAMCHEVTVFHRGEHPPPAGVPAVRGDRRTLAAYRDTLLAVRPQVLIDFLLSNAQQAIELVELFEGTTARIVAISSCDVYEPGPSVITEDSPVRTALYPYLPETIRGLRAMVPWVEEDYDKIPVERIVLAANGTVLRLPMIYGPGDLQHRFRSVLHAVDAGRDPIVLDQATAEWRAVRGYVEDVAWAIALAATDRRAAGRVYNIADPENFTEIEWQRQIADAAGFRGRFEVTPGGHPRPHFIVDSTRIRRELGYAERVSRADSLARTIDSERGPCAAMTADDWDAVRTIYEEGIRTGNATFETAAPEWERWDRGHLAACRLVARIGGEVAGFAALSPVSARAVYAGVAEVSIYVAERARGRGVGRRLMRDLVAASEAAGIWTLQAGIFPENEASIRLHRAAGFRVVGKRERVGCLHGVWRDVVLLERRAAP